MILMEWLETSTDILQTAGIATARLDCLVLLEDVTSKDRSWLLAHPEYRFQGRGLENLNLQIKKRSKHEPLAYIRGKSEFYGREFVINKDVLEPRPESETMIALALKVIGERFEVRDKKTIVIDVGTGSGALAITAKLEMPKLQVVGTDISNECLDVAKINAKALGADVKFYQGNLLEPFYNREPITSNLILVCNLPYVPDGHTINEAAMWEPKIAIFGGPDGLDLYRRLFAQISEFEINAKYVFAESLPFQHTMLAEIANEAGYKLRMSEDFVQLFELGYKA